MKFFNRLDAATLALAFTLAGPVETGLPALSSIGGPVAGEAYQWRPVAIGGGGFITGRSCDRTGATCVIRTDVHGAYAWDQEQDRWVLLPTSAAMPEADRVQNGVNAGAYAVAVAPSDPQRIYLAIKGRLYRSDDRGRSFVQTVGLSTPFTWDANDANRHSGPFLSVSPFNPSVVLLGTPGEGLWHSTDAGRNLIKIASVPSSTGAGIITLWERVAGRHTGRTWAISGGNGVYVSSDGGTTFAAMVDSPTVLNTGDFAPNGDFYGITTDDRLVWKRARSTEKWTNLVDTGSVPSRRWTAVAVNPGTGSIYVVDEGGAIFRSADEGGTFTRLGRRYRVGPGGEPPWLSVPAGESYFASGKVHFDPTVVNRLWADTGTGVWYADVADAVTTLTWRSRTRGIEELVASDVVQPPGGDPLFSAFDFGIHLKPDLTAYSTTYGPAERVIIAGQQLDWSPADPGFVVTNASDTRTCCTGDGDAVMAGYSLDAGATWTKFATLPTQPGSSAGDPLRMAHGAIAVSATDTRNIVWEPTDNQAIFYTTDRGASWARVRLPGETGDLTGNHGSKWLQRRNLAADKVSAGTFYLVWAGGDASNTAALTGVWRTTDGGGSWAKVFSGEPMPGLYYATKLRAVPGEAGHLFLTPGVVGGDTTMRRSVDGGATWTRVTGVVDTDDVAFGKAAAGAAYPTIFVSGKVAGQYGVWRSVDDAASWQKVAGFPVGRLDQVTVVGADPDIFGRVYVGYLGSGWVWGGPADCTAGPYVQGAPSECFVVR